MVKYSDYLNEIQNDFFNTQTYIHKKEEYIKKYCKVINELNALHKEVNPKHKFNVYDLGYIRDNVSEYRDELKSLRENRYMWNDITLGIIDYYEYKRFIKHFIKRIMLSICIVLIGIIIFHLTK